MRAFISYSHTDAWALDSLHKHLSILRRDGQIVEWYDREILAGDDIDQEISEQIEIAELFLLLVSPDFLASDYCYEKEMARALERHDTGKLRVVPIIIEPCDWMASPLKKLKALPKDGKPVSVWTNQNTAFVDIVAELRRILTNDQGSNHKHPPNSDEDQDSEQRRYRVKRDFDEIDRGEFRDQAFQTIREYFQSATEELDGVEGLRGRFSEISNQSFSCTVVNRSLTQGTAHITVHANSDSASMGDIYYSFQENAPANTANGGFRIESDEYDLFLQPWMSSFMSEADRFSPHSAAELLWSEFIQQAGVTCD